MGSSVPGEGCREGTKQTLISSKLTEDGIRDVVIQYGMDGTDWDQFRIDELFDAPGVQMIKLKGFMHAFIDAMKGN